MAVILVITTIDFLFAQGYKIAQRYKEGGGENMSRVEIITTRL